MNQIEHTTERPSQFLLSDAVLSGDNSELRTWIIVANKTIIRIFEEKAGKLKIVDRILLLHNESQTRLCAAEYGEKSLLKYNPGVYIPSNKNELLNFTHHVTAKMDEALWKGDFDQLVLIADSALIGILFRALSYPVRARTLALVNPDLVWLETGILEKEIPDVIRSGLHHSYKGDSYERH